MREVKEVRNTSIPMTPMTIPTTGFVMDFRHSLLECSFLAKLGIPSPHKLSRVGQHLILYRG